MGNKELGRLKDILHTLGYLRLYLRYIKNTKKKRFIKKY